MGDLTNTAGEPIRCSRAAILDALQNPVAVTAEGKEDYAFLHDHESGAFLVLSGADLWLNLPGYQEIHYPIGRLREASEEFYKRVKSVRQRDQDTVSDTNSSITLDVLQDTA